MEHDEFAAFRDRVTALFEDWRERNRSAQGLRRERPAQGPGSEIAEDLLEAFRAAPLLDPYDIYQHLMDYWYETMQDDAYHITAEGWMAKPRRVLEEIRTGKKKGQMKDKGWTCDLIPKPYIVTRYFAEEQAALDALQGELDIVGAQLKELEEEYGDEDGAFTELEKINKGEVNKRIKEIKGDPEYADEVKVLKQWSQLDKRQSELKKQIKDADAALDQLAYDKYPQLAEDEIKTLVVDEKWLATLEAAVQNELDRVPQNLTGRVRELAERYETPLPKLNRQVEKLSARVDEHLKSMGVAWS